MRISHLSHLSHKIVNSSEKLTSFNEEYCYFPNDFDKRGKVLKMYRDARWWYKYWKRKGHVRKPLVSNLGKIDSLNFFHKNKPGCFTLSCGNDSFYIESSYEELKVFPKTFPKSQDYSIKILKTKCNYGKHRYWFSCLKCSRRVRILYFAQWLLLCRKCLNLGYLSQILEPNLRYFEMQSRIEKKLKDSGGSLYEKPPNMHKKTYEKLINKYYDYEEKIELFLSENLPLMF